MATGQGKETQLNFEGTNFSPDVQEKLLVLFGQGIIERGIAQVIIVLADENVTINFRNGKKVKVIEDLYLMTQKYHCAQKKLDRNVNPAIVERTNMLLDIIWNSFLTQLYAEALMSHGKKNDLLKIIDAIGELIVDKRLSNKRTLSGHVRPKARSTKRRRKS